MPDNQAAAPELLPLSFRPLPLGHVRPAGWLRNQLAIQAGGLSGHLDEFWPDVADSSWIGGKAEGWERGPYWLDGIVPLAILLDHPDLKRKAAHWVDYIISHQHEDGWLGPIRNPKAVGSQHAYDAWPVFVLFKAFTQWADATGDQRVVPAMTKFFHKLDALLTDKPLFEWGRSRWADLVLSVHWLYERTREPWLLGVADKLHQQGIDWTKYADEFPFKEKVTQKILDGYRDAAGGNWINDQMLTSHGVNVGMGFKSPAVWYRQSHDTKDRDASTTILKKLDEFHGQATGMFSCDEHLAGRMPSQGTELCTVVETMFTLETLIATLGDLTLADRLERIAFNALPGTFKPDMWAHQYDQQCNQVVCQLSKERVYSNNGPDANLFGLEPNFGCCTANMHQGWPKFAASLWMLAPDGGLACIAYAPCAVVTSIQDTPVHLDVCTDYPFDDVVSITVSVDRPAKFPLHLRIPAWADKATLSVNNDAAQQPKAGSVATLDREWKPGDIVRLKFPRTPRTERRFNDSVALNYGPLVLSLKVGEDWHKLRGDFPRGDWEVYPLSPWNYALSLDPADAAKSIKVERRPLGEVPFAGEDSPFIAKVQAHKLPDWSLDRNAAAPPPKSPATTTEPAEEVTLIPYGCTHLRVTEFPVTG